MKSNGSFILFLMVDPQFQIPEFGRRGANIIFSYVILRSAAPADTLPMGNSQGGERILPLENKPKLCLGAVSNHRKEFPAGTPVLRSVLTQ